MSRLAVAILCAFGTTGAIPAIPSPAAMPPAVNSCAPSDGLDYVCGPTASEDLARIPGTPWLLASGLNVGAPAHLYVIDDRTRSATVLYLSDAPPPRPGQSFQSGCTGPPDPARISTDGINIRAGAGGQHMLYAANHGDRVAIEIFQIDARGAQPQASWVDCVPLPTGTLANAVVPLVDGGIIVSSFYDPRDREAWARMDRGEDTGSLWEWHPGKGLRRLETGGISGANGLEISADGQTLYVSAWSGRALLVFDRRTGSHRAIPLDFMPDNIKRAPDGTLLVGGQRGSVARIAACNGPDCPQEWIIARVDPDKGNVTPLLARPGNALINYACGALQVGNTLYISARGDKRVAYVPLASLPSLH